MKINVYVVTYDNPDNINTNIDRFYDTTAGRDAEFQYIIINNHSNFAVTYANGCRTKVFHNWLRPDYACGHLARDYNMALIHGFHNLTSPACDQVILLHDDSIWNDGWFEDLQEIHKTYTFYTGDWGDGLTSYLPDAVRKIGLWDERFCNIGYHEADYFLRAAIYNKDKTTMNDRGAGRVLNPTKEIFTHASPNQNKMTSHTASMMYHPITLGLFNDKWSNHSPVNWDMTNLPSGPSIDGYLYYPYFELGIETLDAQRIRR